ncbi:hypothetical protein CJ030_MR6G021575 [Morella rubra]|uniref:non-specific serine/threonine protein kinase n=1 Tax=Morella rubra TaxID=262757 RepID=A0A6A1VFB4_9ROSI|nr:hypothetical protein CJ030_MR6G021575 [Morella rubra]
MNSWLPLQSPFPVLLFFMLLVLVEVPGSFCFYDWYSTCNNRFSCGEITNVGYPFWGDGRPDGCGNPDLKLNCDRNITTIGIKGVLYRVLAVNTGNKILKIARQDYLNGICSPDLVDTTLDPQFFDYGLGYGNITLFYGCPVEAQFSCSINGFTNKGGFIQVGAQGPGLCSASVVLPFPLANYKDIANWLLVEGVIKSGFDVQWKEDTAACNACIASKGVCGYDLSTNQTTCFCPNQPPYGSKTCPSSPAARTPQASPSKPGAYL